MIVATTIWKDSQRSKQQPVPRLQLAEEQREKRRNGEKNGERTSPLFFARHSMSVPQFN